MPRSKKSKSRTRSRSRKFVKELNSRVKRLSKNLRKLSKSRRRSIVRRRTPSPSPIRLRFPRTPVRIIYTTPLYRRYRYRYGTPLYRRGTPVHHYHYNNAPAARAASPVRLAAAAGLARSSPDANDFSTPAMKVRARRLGQGEISDLDARRNRDAFVPRA